MNNNERRILAMSTKLFVRNLGWSVSEDELVDLFSPAGTVMSVTIPTRREDGKPRGFAFVEMATPESAEQVIRQFNGAMLQNRDLVISYQEDRASGGGYGGDNGGSGPVKNPKLFVRNVDYSVSEHDLQALFSQSGQVVSVRIPSDRDTGMAKPFGFVEMSTADEAEAAIQALNNTHYQGKTLMVDYQDPNRAKSKPRTGGGYGGGYGGGNRGGGGGYGGRSGGYANSW